MEFKTKREINEIRSDNAFIQGVAIETDMVADRLRSKINDLNPSIARELAMYGYVLLSIFKTEHNTPPLSKDCGIVDPADYAREEK